MLTSPGATHRALLKAGAGLLSAAAVLAAVPGSALAAPVTASFATTGAPQTFTVPAGVRSVHAIAVGGSGGTSYYGYPGGRGAHVEADLSVTPGQLLYVYVGGNGVAGVSDGGYNGGGANPGVYGYGGAGGGGSDIRATAGDLDSRLLVAGGGGGAGLESAGGDFDAGGTGPSAGAAGTLTAAAPEETEPPRAASDRAARPAHTAVASPWRAAVAVATSAAVAVAMKAAPAAARPTSARRRQRPRRRSTQPARRLSASRSTR